MARPSNREKILTEGLKLVHRRGFANASVRDIVQAAGVPQGSFTNHFASKEAFGLEIIDRYFAASEGVIGATLRNPALGPRARLEAFLDANLAAQEAEADIPGCLLGNLAAESCDQSEAMRGRLLQIFEATRQALADCVREGVAAGELAAGLDPEETAAFVFASLQGAQLMAKAQRDPAPVRRLKPMLMERLLAA